MLANLLSKRNRALGQEVQEPTILAIVLAATGFFILYLVCLVGMDLLGAYFTHGWWAFAGASAVLVWVVWFFGFRPKEDKGMTGRQRWFRRVVVTGRGLFEVLLALWLGLILWWEFSPGGAAPLAKTDPQHLRVVTWNIHCGREEGPFWERFSWAGRKHALQKAIEQAGPDILCVQEALPEQVAFLVKVLPGHRRVGNGRDGAANGEHCAIYFNQERLEVLKGGTFWLGEPIDQPRSGSALSVKRICTWVRLRDRTNGRTLRIYNTHLYLTEQPRLEAVRLILAQMGEGAKADAVLLTADFNASPNVPSRQLFIQAGLRDSAEQAGQPVGRPTFHLYGIGAFCLDGILVSANLQVHTFKVLNVKPEGVFPSDHFGLLADLAFRK